MLSFYVSIPIGVNGLQWYNWHLILFSIHPWVAYRDFERDNLQLVSTTTVNTWNWSVVSTLNGWALSSTQIVSKESGGGCYAFTKAESYLGM